MATGSIEAPAKINLTLEILDRRPDGYHRLRSVMVPIALYDRISWRAAERFAFDADDPALQHDNLVERACRELGLDETPLAVRLEKRIPVGGGLGGGSSDAAALLRAAMRGAFGPPGPADWIATARALGSDVPFFLLEGSALVEGTGERLTALGASPSWWICLLVPPTAVPTGDAYGRLDRARDRDPARGARRAAPSLRVAEALQRGDFAGVQQHLHNDFEAVVAPAYEPVSAALEALARAGAPKPMLSGSGATVFALCEDEASARGLEARLRLPAGTRALVVPFAASDVWAPAR